VTTVPASLAETSRDLVQRGFDAPAPNRLWVADIERHEALLYRAAVQDRGGQPVAAGW
jgi:hypothetical protein